MHSDLVHTIYNGGFLLFRLKAGLYLPNKFTCSFIDLWIIVSQRIYIWYVGGKSFFALGPLILHLAH